MRENARHYDDHEHEHEIPWEFVNLMWETALKTGQSFRSGTRARPTAAAGAQALVHYIEMQSWGDAGIYLCGPAPAGRRGGGGDRHPRAEARSWPATGKASPSGPAWP